ncbi:MAG: hypothetical protein MJA29_03835 [Candidatus Omnitrophica bacterium]|nr:hypothetical protein [Candidatus Omnitrophota bacterium]
MEKFRTRLEAQEQRQAAVAKVTKSRSEEYISDIEAHMRADHMDDALRLYIEYEGSPLGGALREDSQKSIADALYERGDYLFGLQAYLRLLSYYPATKYRIDVFARLGLILSQQLESPHEGFAYLWQSLSQEGEIADSELREAARLELDRIVDLLNKTAIEEHAQQQSTFRYSIFAQLTDERMLNENKISRVLLSIGEVGGIHLGRKLRYNAQANLRVKDGIMLKGLTFQEAHLAVKKLQEIGIYVIMVNEHDAPRFTPAQYVSEISFDIDRLVLKTEGKENALGKDDIFFVTLGKISYTRLGPAKLLDIWHVGVYLPAMYLFRRVQWAKSEAMRQKHDRWKSMGCHMLLDIFTKDFRRMRVSNNSFPQFNDFVEQLSTFLDGSRVDERVKVYLVQRTWPGLSFKNVREYTDFALWSARLKWIYSRFV